jgi:hypothetical protein
MRLEKWAKAVAAGKSLREASDLTGYTYSNENSMDAANSRRLRTVKAQEVIAMERMKLSEDPNYSPEQIAFELSQIKSQAIERGELNLARQSLMDVAKLSGHLVDKQMSVNNLSDEQLQEELEKLRKQA